jgi:hypothetical protein
MALVALFTVLGSTTTARASDEPVPPGEAAAAPLPPGETAAPATATPASSRQDLKLPSTYALGARVRGIFVPGSFLAPYLQAYTSMESVSLGIEFIYRKPAFDVVASLDFGFMSPHDGNYLANDHDPSLDTHYVQFRNLNFLSTDVSIIGHHSFLPWLELRYGAGLGLGLVLGDILITNNGTQCTAKNAADTRACYPAGIPLNQPDTEAKLKATERPGATDVAQDPHRHLSQDKPPVMGVLNVLVGVSFRVHPHVSVQVEGGFRDAMFVGAGLHYWF